MRSGKSFSEAGRLGALASKSTNANRKSQRIDNYNCSPKECKHCNSIIEYLKRYNDFCNQSCAALFNNPRKKPYSKKRCAINIFNCLQCNKKLKDNQLKYCSNKCHKTYERKIVFDRIEQGIDPGSSLALKKYLIFKYDEKCMRCGWNERNLKTNRIPIHLHHKDGNGNNHHKDNGILLCPNCHSLIENYGASNVGRGRPERRARYKKASEMVIIKNEVI